MHLAALAGMYERYVAVRRATSARTTPVPSRTEFDPDAVGSVLMVCTGLIGDTLMSLPAMGAAKGLFPSAERVALVSSKTHSLLSMTTCADRFIISDASPLALRPAKRRAVAGLLRLLERGRFDLAVIFLGDDFAPLLTRARIPHRVFVAGTAYDRLATATYDIGAPRTWGPAERLNAWRAVGLKPQGAAVALRARAEITQAVAERARISYGEQWLVLHPFGRTQAQRWPLDTASDFMRLAEQRLGVQSLVVGESPAAASRAGSDPRFRLVGRLNLEELTALMSLCACVVSTDSGPFHIAGVLGRPGVGLFRATRQEHARRYESIVPVVAPDLVGCRGRCTWDRCRWTPCRQMASILPERVLEAVETRLCGVPAS